MKTPVEIEREVDEILSSHVAPPVIVKRDGAPLSAGERHCLILQPEGYRVDSPGLERLTAYLLALDSRESRAAFWDLLRKQIRHPIVPSFFIAQGRLLHLIEWILDALDESPLDQTIIAMATAALKVEHARYSAEELEKIGDLLGTLLTQSQLESGERSLAARRGAGEGVGPESMRVMRAKRDIYKAIGTLREVVRVAHYRKLEGMLTDI